jgi:hypothetical protein
MTGTRTEALDERRVDVLHFFSSRQLGSILWIVVLSVETLSYSFLIKDVNLGVSLEGKDTGVD